MVWFVLIDIFIAAVAALFITVIGMEIHDSLVQMSGHWNRESIGGLIMIILIAVFLLFAILDQVNGWGWWRALWENAGPSRGMSA